MDKYLDVLALVGNYSLLRYFPVGLVPILPPGDPIEVVDFFDEGPDFHNIFVDVLAVEI